MTTGLHRSDRRERGLTLVELLIAITVLGMMMTILLQALQLASHAWNDRALTDDGITETTVVREWIRRELEQARPISITSENDERLLAFAGDSEAVTFVASLPAHLGGGGLHWIVFRTVDAEDGRRLVMETEPFHADAPGASPRESRVLVDLIESARFEYFGSASADDPPAWHDAWVEMDYLPSLVKLTFKESGESVWPAILAVPMIDGVRPAERRPIAGMVAVTDG